MSFVTTQPEALASAAGSLQSIESSLSAQNAAAAGPTSDVIPAGADEVSALMAAQFSTYGNMYQTVSSQAAAIHESLVNTLGTNAESYAATEATNAATASASSAASGSSIFDTLAALVSALGSNTMVTNIGGGMATAMDYVPSSLLPSMIGFMTAGAGASASGGTAASGLGALLAPGGALGALGALGGVAGAASASTAASAASTGTGAVDQVALVSNLSAPTSWADATPPGGAAPAAALQGPDWAGAPESNSVAALPPGMPGGGSGRGGFGFGAPRYGVKPTVMPRPVVAG